MKSTTLLLVAADLCAAASTLLRGGTIIAFDEASESLRVIRDGSLLITDDTIAGIFESGQEPSLNGTGTTRIFDSGQEAAPNTSTTEDTAANNEVEVVDVTGKIITPGFVDTHRHGWQTSLRTLGSNVTLWDYLLRFSEFASAGLLTPDDVRVSQLAGLYESLNAGVTTIVDHAHHTWSDETSEAGLQASIDSGARVFWAYTFHNVSGYTTTEQYQNFRDIAEKGAYKGTRTSLGIACDFFGPDPIENEVKTVVDLAKEYDVSVLTTHALEGPFGVTNSPEELHRAGILNTSIPVILSHATFISYRGTQLLQSTNQHIAITVESEMHYGHTHPNGLLDPIQRQAALGVDTHMSYSSDILTQARLWLQSVRYSLYDDAMKRWHVPANNPMSVHQAFLLATRNGGRALRRPDLGVIAQGAKADLVVWNGESPALLGWREPVAAVMLHASVADIEHVLVDGEFVKRDGKLVAPGYGEDFRKEFLTSAKRLQDKFLQERKSRAAVQGEPILAGGAELVTVPEVDVTRAEGTGYGQEFLSL